jgi:hypothetical protein
MMASQLSASTTMPFSAKVGTSGSAGERCSGSEQNSAAYLGQLLKMTGGRAVPGMSSRASAQDHRRPGLPEA